MEGNGLWAYDANGELIGFTSQVFDVLWAVLKRDGHYHGRRATLEAAVDILRADPRVARIEEYAGIMWQKTVWAA